MRHLKLMREENLPDHDSRKSHRIVGLQDNDEVSFERLWWGQPHLGLSNRKERGLWVYFPRGNSYLMDATGNNITSFAYSPDIGFYYHNVKMIRVFVDWCESSFEIPSDILEEPTTHYRHKVSIEELTAKITMDFVQTVADFFLPSLPGSSDQSWGAMHNTLSLEEISALLIRYLKTIPIGEQHGWPKPLVALEEKGPDFGETEGVHLLARLFNRANRSRDTQTQFVEHLSAIYTKYCDERRKWAVDMSNGHQY